MTRVLGFFCFTVLVSCSQPQNLWLISDAYFLQANPGFQAEFAHMAGSQGYKARELLHKPFQGTGEFLDPQREIFDENLDIFVFTPLMTADFYREFRGAYPTIPMILMEAPLALSGEKTFVVSFDRREAFQESAAAAAEWLAAQGEESMAGALFWGRFEHRGWEKEKFMDSWAAKSSLEQLVQIDFFQTTDFDPLQRQLENMIKSPVKLVVAFASSQNGSILGQLAQENVAIITEDWESSQYLTEKVLGSVEKNWVSALTLALEKRKKGESENLVFPAEFRKNKNFTFERQENTIP